MSRALYTVTNPLGAAENKLIGAALSTGRGRSKAGSTGRGRSTAGSMGSSMVSAAPPRGAEGLPRIYGASREAADAHDRLAQLMAVQRERFTPAQRPIIPAPSPVNPGPWEIEEWALRKAETRIWQPGRKRAVRVEVRAFAQSKALEQFTRTHTAWQEQQRRADAWWTALNQGDPVAVREALLAAFADNPAPVIFGMDGHESILVISLPAPNVLPRRQPHVTPSGKLSSKAWTKTALNQAYADLLGAHLLATIREAWHVAPTLDHLRVLGTRPASGTEILFDVDVSRAGGYWDNDFSGSAVLAEAPRGLRRSGPNGEPLPWPKDELRPLPARWNITV